MTRPKVELAKIRGISEVVEDSALFIKQNWKPLLKSYFCICGFFWVASIALAIFSHIHNRQRIEAGEAGLDSVFFFTTLFELLNYTTITVTGLSFISLYRQKGNEAPTTAEVWDYVKYFFLRVLAANILGTLGAIIGFMCCFFPGIYLWPILSLASVAIVIDNYPVLGAYGAFSYSFELVSKKWGQLFGALILSLILLVSVWALFLIPVCIIIALSMFVGGGGFVGTMSPFSAAIGIAVHIIQFVYFFPLIVLSLSYFNLKELKEDHNLFERIKMLGRNEDKGAAGAAHQAEEQY